MYTHLLFLLSEGIESMYVGRIVTVGRNLDGKFVVAYRVSSRSYTNRKVVLNDKTALIAPSQNTELNISNPYIHYRCLRIVEELAVVANGSHTDPIADKLANGVGIRDALISVLHGMDYEFDEKCTPRIAAVVSPNTAYLGIIRKDALMVKEVSLSCGQCIYISTYAHNEISPEYSTNTFNANDAEQVVNYVLNQDVFAQMEHGICAVSAFSNNNGYDIASRNI